MGKDVDSIDALLWSVREFRREVVREKLHAAWDELHADLRAGLAAATIAGAARDSEP